MSLAADTRPLVVIQRNPTSGSGRGRRRLRQLITELRKLDFRIRLFANRDRLDQFVSNLTDSDQLHCVVAAGGDGTICNVLQRHPDLPIAVFPLGTENLVARYLKISGCPQQMAGIIAHGQRQIFDTALANDHRFLIMASVGFDSEVAARMAAIRSGNIRKWSYLRPILSSAFSYRYPLVHVRDTAGTLLAEGSHVIVANIREYGFQIPFCPDADPTDGLLDVRVFRKRGFFRTLCHCLRTRFGLSDLASDVQRFRLSEVSLDADTELTAQVDGDPIDRLPVRIYVDPKSLQLIVPRDFQVNLSR